MVGLNSHENLKTRIPVFELGRFRAIAIASSTGGPSVVEKILTGLPADMPVPIFVAQHLPPTFTESFANRLNVSSPMTVVHAEEGMPVFPGTVYIGAGHRHLRVVKGHGGGGTRIEVSEQPLELLYKPSSDELFRSCTKIYGGALLAVVLTGIGRDGTLGAKEIKAAGGVVLTQSAQTCVVYGMPRSCVEAGLSDAQLDPPDICRALLQLSPQHRDRAWHPKPD